RQGLSTQRPHAARSDRLGERTMAANMNVQPKMTVPLLDLKAQYATLAKEIMPVIEKVCASQHFILGPYVKELEQKVAAYSQAPHAIGVSSGTDGLLLAL